MPPRRAPKVMRRPRRVVRKSGKKRTDARQNSHLKALTASHNLNTKVLQSLMYNSSHGLIEANERDFQKGSVGIAYQTGTHSFKGQVFSDTRLPLHMINLTSMRNSGTDQAGIFVLKAANRAFRSVLTQQIIKDEPGHYVDGTAVTNTVPQALCRWTKANVLLYGAPATKVRYTLRLVQVKDHRLMPEHNDDNTWAGISSIYGDDIEYARVFYQSFIKGEMSNPVHGKSDKDRIAMYKGQFKILWEKTYTLNEKSADYDELPHKMVKIYRPINKVMKFFVNRNNSTMIATDAQLDNADIPEPIGNTSICRPFVETMQNIYLMITSDATVDQNADSTYDTTASLPQARADYQRTYDIRTETNWSVMSVF